MIDEISFFRKELKRYYLEILFKKLSVKNKNYSSSEKYNHNIQTSREAGHRGIITSKRIFVRYFLAHIGAIIMWQNLHNI